MTAPAQHRVLEGDDAAEAMTTVLVHAIIASRPPTRLIDGRVQYAGLSTRALLALMMSVVDVVADAANLTDEERERFATSVRVPSTPEDVTSAREALSTAIVAATALRQADAEGVDESHLDATAEA